MSFYTLYKKSFSVYMAALLTGALLSGPFVLESEGTHDQFDPLVLSADQQDSAQFLGTGVIQAKEQDADGNLYAILKREKVLANWENWEKVLAWENKYRHAIGELVPSGTKGGALENSAFLDKTRAGSADIYGREGNDYDSVAFFSTDGKATLLPRAKFKYGDPNTIQIYYGASKDGGDALDGVQPGTAGAVVMLGTATNAPDFYEEQGQANIGKSNLLALTLMLSGDVSLKASLPSGATSQDDPLAHYEFAYDDKSPATALYGDGTTAQLKVKDANNRLEGGFGGIFGYVDRGNDHLVPAAFNTPKYDKDKGSWQMRVAVKKGEDLSGVKVKFVTLFSKASMKNKTGLLKKRANASK